LKNLEKSDFAEDEKAVFGTRAFTENEKKSLRKIQFRKRA
jgi:hypothetical protein